MCIRPATTPTWHLMATLATDRSGTIVTTASAGVGSAAARRIAADRGVRLVLEELRRKIRAPSAD